MLFEINGDSFVGDLALINIKRLLLERQINAGAVVAGDGELVVGE